MDDDSISRLLTESSLEDGKEPDDIHMSEEDTSEYSSFNFQVHRIMYIFLILVIIVPERHLTNC